MIGDCGTVTKGTVPFRLLLPYRSAAHRGKTLNASPRRGCSLGFVDRPRRFRLRTASPPSFSPANRVGVDRPRWNFLRKILKMLNLEDIAALYEGHDLSTETIEHLKQWVRADPQFETYIAVLTILADAAGLPADDPNRLHDATVLQAQLEALVDAEQPWEHPAEILDPDGDVGLDCGALLKLAEAVQGKEDGIAGLLDRLRNAAEEERRDRRAVEELIATLRQQDSLKARSMLRDAELALREPPPPAGQEDESE
jgi:hypothetical protein